MKRFKQVIEVEVKGIKPLLQNDSFEESSEGKKKGQAYIPKEEAEKRLILDGNDTICQKASHIEGSMIKSAVDFKFEGRKTYKEPFKASVSVEPHFIPHENIKWVIDTQQVKIGSSRILRSRPRFDDWSLVFKIVNKDNRIQPLVIKSILENAGAYVGIGDYRPKYGLFEITKFNIIEE